MYLELAVIIMIIQGIGVSKGIAISKIIKLKSESLTVTSEKIVDIEKEIAKFREAVNSVIIELQAIRDLTVKEIDEKHAKIFDAYIEFADDPEISGEVEELIRNEKYNCAYALNVVEKSYLKMFKSMEDGYLKERVVDFKDVIKKITSSILGFSTISLKELKTKVIIVANDLSPSDAAQLNKSKVEGIITNVGSKTSHIAIMARSLKIPAIVGAKNITNIVHDGDMVLFDGFDGKIIVSPSEEDIETYKHKRQEQIKFDKIIDTFSEKESYTLDKKLVELASNIGGPEDLSNAIKSSADGVGLYRTEFLYMNKTNFPTEEEQFRDYKIVLQNMKNKKVIIRTLDIGGDKTLSYLKMDKEVNPFLGHRAIRLCLDNIPLFKTQLRALLKASIYGNLNIMFPMISTIDELRQAKEILNECKKELQNESVKISNEVKVGMMIELPSSAILADQFAKEVDFFSIGTNDLIQYSFAADRTNEKVAYLYQPLNPVILRLIKMVVEAGHKEGIWVGVCGEAASVQETAAIYLGLGIDEFSMNSSSILTIKFLFSKLKYSDMVEISNECLNKSTESQVEKIISAYLKKIYY